MRMYGKTPTISFRSRWHSVFHMVIFLPMIFGVVFGVRVGTAVFLVDKPPEYLLFGVTLVLCLSLYFLVFYLSKALLARPFRQGTRLLKKGKYQEAIPVFEAAHAYFNRHPWLDRYRVLFLLSTSAISYREMCLINQAYCHGQTGGASKSEALYREALKLNPDNPLAINALKMIETFSGR